MYYANEANLWLLLLFVSYDQKSNMVTIKRSIILIALSLTLLTQFLTITLPRQGAADISSLKSFHLSILETSSEICFQLVRMWMDQAVGGGTGRTFNQALIVMGKGSYRLLVNNGGWGADAAVRAVGSTTFPR